MSETTMEDKVDYLLEDIERLALLGVSCTAAERLVYLERIDKNVSDLRSILKVKPKKSITE